MNPSATLELEERQLPSPPNSKLKDGKGTCTEPGLGKHEKSITFRLNGSISHRRASKEMRADDGPATLTCPRGSEMLLE